ncbi:DUF6365 family protein [Cerasibacillus sp. JNUCC 74]
MKVLFIAPSQFSIGELHNAIYLSRQLKVHGIESHFLTSQNYIDYALRSGVNATPLKKTTLQTKSIKETVGEFQPDLTVIADYHILDLESPLIDLDYVLELGVPVATIDSLCFGNQSRVLRNRLFDQVQSKRSRFGNKPKVNLREIPESVKVIRTCPINNPSISTNRIQPVTLYKESFTIAWEKREMMRSRFGCEKPEDKLVMVSKAAWANLLVKMRLMESKLYMNPTYGYEYFVQELIKQYLGVKEFPSKVIVVGIAPKNSFVNQDTDSKVHFVTMPFMHLDEYEDLLFSCDLFITDNITSCSMAKAIFGFVPVLSLVNTKVTTGKDGLPLIPDNLKNKTQLNEILKRWLKVMPGGIYPFLTFPNGWVEELQSLLTENPLIDVIETSEIFDINETGSKIHQLLYSEHSRSDVYDRQKKYIEVIIQAPDALEMVKFALK